MKDAKPAGPPAAPYTPAPPALATPPSAPPPPAAPPQNPFAPPPPPDPMGARPMPAAAPHSTSSYAPNGASAGEYPGTASRLSRRLLRRGRPRHGPPPVSPPVGPASGKSVGHIAGDGIIRDLFRNLFWDHSRRPLGHDGECSALDPTAGRSTADADADSADSSQGIDRDNRDGGICRQDRRRPGAGFQNSAETGGQTSGGAAQLEARGYHRVADRRSPAGGDRGRHSSA